MERNLSIDTFTAIMFGSVAALLVYVVLVALATRNVHVSDVLDKRRGRTRTEARFASQAKIEGQDVQQMLAGANEYRRERGLPDVTPAQLQAQLDKDLRDQIAEQADQQQ